jgi:hypothetical protein
MKAPLTGPGEPPRQAGGELAYRCDPESSAGPIDTSAETPPHASEQSDNLRTDVVETSEAPESPKREAGERKDQGRRHAVRGSVLSRSLIQTLERLGENVRALRKIESELRATLKPRGALGRLFFDRFWASILRLVLVARLEEGGLTSGGTIAKNLASVPSLREGDLPILVLPESGDGSMQAEKTIFDSDVFRRLALTARYDRSATREMYRMMSLLVIMRSEGETGLENFVRATAGLKNGIGEDNKNA